MHAALLIDMFSNLQDQDTRNASPAHQENYAILDPIVARDTIRNVLRSSPDAPSAPLLYTHLSDAMKSERKHSDERHDAHEQATHDE